MNQDSAAMLRMLWVWTQYENSPESVQLSDYLSPEARFSSKHFRADGRAEVLALLERLRAGHEHTFIAHVGKSFSSERSPTPCCYILSSSGQVAGVTRLKLSADGLIAGIFFSSGQFYLLREGGVYDRLDHAPLLLN